MEKASTIMVEPSFQYIDFYEFENTTFSMNIFCLRDKLIQNMGNMGFM